MNDYNNNKNNNSSNNKNNSNSNNDTSIMTTCVLPLLNEVAEFAMLAVLAIAMTTIPFAFLSIVTLPTVVDAFVVVNVNVNVPTTTTKTATFMFQQPPSSSLSLQQLYTSTTTTTSSSSSSIFPLRAAAAAATDTSSSISVSASTDIPRLDPTDLQTLQTQGYVVIENFLPASSSSSSSSSSSLKEALRDDILNLRSKQKFKIAKIGQDSTNTLNEEIRVAETCFLGPTSDKPELRDVYNQRREQLYDVLEALRQDLQEGSDSKPLKLDAKLSEFLYAYYPRGGFYRRHRDAVKGSASWLRQYSLLLYLNDDTYDAVEDGGKLRIHFDSGGDFLPADEAPNFLDIDANGGTLVLFDSNRFPHEVLDTSKERFAVVGWYNRPMSLGDLAAINENNNGNGVGGTSSLTDDPVRLIALAVAAGLVTVGLINILSS